MRDQSEPLLAIPKDRDDTNSLREARLAPAPSGSELSASEPSEPETSGTEPSGSEPSWKPGATSEDDFPTDDSEVDGSSPRTARSDTRELRPERHPDRLLAVNSAAPKAKRNPRPLPFDPVTRILSLMERERRVGMSIGLAGALVVHGAGAAHGLAALIDMSAFAGAIRSAVADDVRATYAVEINKPPPPPPPPEPEPEKPQVQPKAPAAPQAPQEEKPPAPAQAAKLLTAEPDPSEPLDLTDQGFVSGEGDRFAGGVTSATGTSKTAVRDVNAQPGGVVGGKGTGPAAPPPPPKVDLSRPAAPASRDWGDCGFPAEADVEQIDFMRLSIVVTVGTDGRAQSVTVLKDPGYGFGNQARQCALRKSYNVGLNADGKPFVTTTPPFIVTFRR